MSCRSIIRTVVPCLTTATSTDRSSDQQEPHAFPPSTADRSPSRPVGCCYRRWLRGIDLAEPYAVDVPCAVVGANGVGFARHGKAGCADRATVGRRHLCRAHVGVVDQITADRAALHGRPAPEITSARRFATPSPRSTSARSHSRGRRQRAWTRFALQRMRYKHWRRRPPRAGWDSWSLPTRRAADPGALRSGFRQDPLGTRPGSLDTGEARIQGQSLGP